MISAEIEAADADQLRQRAEEFYWYHCIDLGGGVVTNGDYDMSEYLPHYRLPEDMTGLRVLDVGRGSGFFSFEFERRGADVTSTEIRSFLDWDFVGGYVEREKRAAEIGDVEAFTHRHITGAYLFAHEARQSKVNSKTATIYEIGPDTVGNPFDIVFAGSVTSHLRDPILGLEKLRSVTAPEGYCVIAAPFIDIDKSMPLAAMVGTADKDRRSWWVVNEPCLHDICRCAGFSSVGTVGSFNLSMRRKIDGPSVFSHLVVHARP